MPSAAPARSRASPSRRSFSKQSLTVGIADSVTQQTKPSSPGYFVPGGRSPCCSILINPDLPFGDHLLPLRVLGLHEIGGLLRRGAARGRPDMGKLGLELGFGRHA